jgi:hypothetical protein
MLIRRTLLPVIATGLLALAATGYAQTKIDTYEATLSGAQEVPPVNTAGTGMAEVQLNTETNKLSWKVTYSGLTGPAIGAHIHPAEMGKNAAPLIPFANVGTQPIVGETTVTPQQIADLAAGRWYVNVHTPANPAGEIRGQLHKRP